MDMRKIFRLHYNRAEIWFFVSGKGESIWDRYTHTHPNAIIDGTNGDVAADFYHKYKEDIKRIKDLGVRHLTSVS